MFRRSELWLIACAAGACSGGPALARPAPEPAVRPALVQAISDCRKIAEPGARLACFDKAAAALDQAEAQGQVVVVDREKMRAVRRQAFGFSLPSLNFFGHGHEEPLNRVTFDLAGAHQDAYGKWIMTTTEDAVWRQTDSQEIYHEPHQGSKLTVRRGALGSFFCEVDGQAGVRCVRER